MSHIVIIGAGITGLQTAISLLTSPSVPGRKITIIASHLPGDSSLEYTSPWAGGDWRSSASLSPDDAEVREWDKQTYDQWMKALDAGPEEESMESREKRLGIGKRTIRYFWGEEDAETTGNGSGLWWKNDVRNFRVLDLRNETEIPRSGRAVFGIEFLSLCVDVPRYLEILMEQAISLGARIVRKRIETRDGLEGVIMDAKRIIMDSWEERKTPECFVALINCTGLSAGDFVTKEEAKNLYPIRGQTVLVKGEARMGRSYTKIPDTSEQEVVYVIPRPGSGTTILGGCKQPGIWDGEVDPHLTERILERVKREGLAEELRTGKGGEFEVISAQVGLRPGRRGGPRVELDSNDQVQQTWIIHAYGHAGAGYQSSIGSAQKVVRIINKLRI